MLAARQTTAYLKKLFSDVGFSIDARRGQNFLVDLNLLGGSTLLATA